MTTVPDPKKPATHQRKRVLLWAHMTSHFREMFRIARYLVDSPAYEPVMFFDVDYHGRSQDAAHCDENGVAWILGHNNHILVGPPVVAKKAPETVEPARGVAPRVRRPFPIRVLRGLRHLYYRYFAHYVVTVRARFFPHAAAVRLTKRQLLQAQRVLDAADARVLVLPEDNVEFSTAALIQVGHERGIPTVVVPYTICNAAEPAESYFASRIHQAKTPRNLRAAAEFPHWVYRHRDRDLIRLPGPVVQAKEEFGLAPPNPWMFNSGAADAIVVESTALRSYYLRGGLPERQLRALGSLRLDELAAHYRQAVAERRRLLERLGWPDDAELIVTAVPPDQLPKTRPECEFTLYEDLVAFWVQSLANLPGCRVLISPHPRGNPIALLGLERPNVRVVTDDIARLIPLCDLYVACVSATIPMALACGKPVVNFDVYRYGYDDFRSSPLVNTVVDRAGYLAALKDRREIAARAGAGSPQPEWGPLDGLSGARLTALFDEMVGAKNRMRMAG